MAAGKQEVIEMLTTAYRMEVETVTNYLANSINPDGVRAEEVKKSLAADVSAEIMHAQQLGQRIKQLGGRVPGSNQLRLGSQKQSSEVSTDIVSVIEAVIDAEQAACAHYKRIIQATEGDDYVTQDLCIRLLADEEEHLVLFQGFLKEYTSG